MTISFLLAILKTLTSIFYTLTELSTVNIARDRTGSFCQASVHPDIFDGDLQRVIIMGSCSDQQILEIDLGGKHIVHYVIFFEGTGPNPNIGQLNYFEVKLSAFQDIDCGSYPGVSTGSIENKGLRVNCKPTTLLYQYVSVFVNRNIGLKIAEVEIHTFASGIAGNKPLFYRGCFSEFSSNGFSMNDGLEGCLIVCLRTDKLFMGIKENSKCHCHDTYNKRAELNETRCNLACSDGKNVCGGLDSFSVYLTSVRLPHHIGCFGIRHIGILMKTSDMSIERCLLKCEKYDYAFLKDGNTCGCRKDIGSYRKYTLNECDLPCIGNRNQICGGDSIMSVYATCNKESSDMSKCSDIFKCKRMRYPIFNSCGGDCVDRFIGDHCLSRRLASMPTQTTARPRPTTQPAQNPHCNISNPCVNIPFTECTIYKNETACHCIHGFTKAKRAAGCEDLDECGFRPCNDDYSVCQNKNGSYGCICKTGYFKLFEDICIVNSSDDDSLKNYIPLWRRILKGGIITISIVIVIFIELSTVNIALRRTASFCEATVSSGLFDGNLQRVVIMTSCPGAQKLEIDLGGEHVIHYVMIFEGTGPNPNIGQLNYFGIKISVIEDTDCGSYPGVTTGSIENKGLRVNCNPSRSLFQYVSIFANTHVGFKISEVEVHTFSSGIAGDRPLLYRGCFSEFSGTASTMRRGLEGCLADCLRIDKLFMAIKENSKCLCHDSYNEVDSSDEHKCNLTCSDGKNFCGGINSFSVYLISVRLPYYVGCFASPRYIDLQNTITNDQLSIERCIFKCENFPFAILTDGRTCGCTDNIETIKSNPLTHECNSSCSGNINQTCGGNAFLAVYGTCYKNGIEKSTCSNLFKCKRVKCPLFKSCGGDCAQHYIGDHCLSRRLPPLPTRPNTTTSSRPPQPTQINRCKMSDPCVNIPFTECVIFRGQLMCHCIIGFSKWSDGEGCEDMDECELNPCNEEYSVCHNKNGSYECVCKDNYVKMSEDICIVNSSNENENLDEHKPFWKNAKFTFFILLVVMIFIGVFICYLAPPRTPPKEIDDPKRDKPIPTSRLRLRMY